MDKDRIERFEALMVRGLSDREGFDRLMDFIRKSDFYTAPASTRYHSSHEGGLLEHSLNVYDRLKEICSSQTLDVFGNVKEENIIAVALLHDLCKTYFYDTELKNRKTYDEEKVKASNPRNVKNDANGNFIWETVPCYVINDRIPYGHGEKSVMMIEEFIKLEPLERYAIRWHMGFTEPKEQWNNFSTAIKMYPLCLAVHLADLEATYFLESEE